MRVLFIESQYTENVGVYWIFRKDNNMDESIFFLSSFLNQTSINNYITAEMIGLICLHFIYG